MTRVYNQDCLEAMRQMPDKCFELAIVDPPYGININPNMGLAGGKRKKHQAIDWDNEIPSPEYFEQLFRVSVNQIIWGGNYFPLPPTRHFIFWDKLVPEGMSFSDGEYAWTSFDRANRKIVLRNITGDKIHPTEKPVMLYRRLLTDYAKPGDRILDTHLGSGNSRIACDMMGFDFEGYETDPVYFARHERRFREHLAVLEFQFPK